MNDAEVKAQKKRVLKAYQKWHDLTYASRYAVTHIWHPGPIILENGEASANAIAEVTTSAKYYRATIRWNLEQCAAESDEDLDEAVCHEACHIFFGELMQEFKSPNGNERVAVMLERTLRDVAKQARK
mgnify:CR=1 FL=1